jgi:hypothetical protein
LGRRNNKTDRIEIKGTEFGGTFSYNRTDRVFFQSLGEKNEKPFFVTRNRGDTMGVSGHGIFFCLWAVRAPSAQRRSLAMPWVTPPTAGAMKIKQGWCIAQQSTMASCYKKLSSWAPPAMAFTTAYGPSAPVLLEGAR